MENYLFYITNWCKDFDYPIWGTSSKKEFVDIYNKICETPYKTKLEWFNKLKSYMIKNYSDKNKWISHYLIFIIYRKIWCTSSGDTLSLKQLGTVS